MFKMGETQACWNADEKESVVGSEKLGEGGERKKKR